MTNLTETYEKAWNEAKQQARKVLIETVRSKRKRIFYSELVSRISALQLDARDLRVGQLLGEISAEEHNNGRGLLSVLVIHKTGDQLPGGQFFELAKSLGENNTEDKVAYWLKEYKKVCEFWEDNPTAI